MTTVRITQALKKFMCIHLILAILVMVAPPHAIANPPAPCDGKFVTPLDIDWNNFFPVTLAGAPISINTNVNAPDMWEPPICVCPGVFGIPSPGIGITYWEPKYVGEMEWRPGCMPSVGGLGVLGAAFAMLKGENRNGDSANVKQASNRAQIHWLKVPLLDLMTGGTLGALCKTLGGFAVAYMTEFDFTWQNDLWAVVFAPEAVVFANPIAQAACAADAASASTLFPLDWLIWCEGNWGSLYPFSGNVQFMNSQFQSNHGAMGRFIARSFRLGMLWQSIGVTALCTDHPTLVIKKSQYRFNQHYPFPRYGGAVYLGGMGLLQVPPVANAPIREATADVIWEGRQCCLRTY